MKLSIVIAVFDSPRVVWRQLRHFARMPLPDGVEIVLVDDGSETPLTCFTYEEKPEQTRFFRRERTAAWTQPAARNYGVRQAAGEFVLCTDIDHIITKELLDVVLGDKYDVVKFKREVAVLDEDGRFVQTEDEVKRYGFEVSRFARHGFHIPAHTNSFAIRRQLYLDLGGVSEHRVGSGKHPNREEIPLRRAIRSLQEQGKIAVLDDNTPGDPRPTLYMIPNGKYCGDKDYNPFGLFHNLPRKTRVA